MSKRFNRREVAALRIHVAEAHEYELREALEELFEEFLKWLDKGMNTFDLNDKVHQFHDGISRDLYKTYVLSDTELAAAIGLHKKAIDPDHIDEDILRKLEPIVQGF